jgi:hypothetical protein
MWIKKRLLVWGTTYPEFSKTYYETVCTGALDGDTGKLVRIYPVRLRYMNEPFKSYQWIDGDVERNTSDFRPEPFKIRQDTIQGGECLGTDDGWAERRRLLLRDGNVFRSVEALQAAEARDHTSLGLVKPKEIRRIYAKKKTDAERKEWDEQRELALMQRDLFVDPEAKTKDLKFMPVQYRICFTCDDPACTTEHDFSVLDWGLYVLSRKEFARGGASLAEKQVIAKIREITDPEKKDCYFFLGNTKGHCDKFMIVGLFYPPVPTMKASKKDATSSLKLPGFG